jgi:hypothetical protein
MNAKSNELNALNIVSGNISKFEAFDLFTVTSEDNRLWAAHT